MEGTSSYLLHPKLEPLPSQVPMRLCKCPWSDFESQFAPGTKSGLAMRALLLITRN